MIAIIKQIFTRRWIPFWIAAITFLLVKLGVTHPLAIEKLYSQSLYPLWAKIFSSVTNVIPVSLWDIFWIVTVLLLIVGIIKLAVKRKNFKRSIIRFLQTIALMYSFFYWSWGFNYFRPGLQERQEWTKAVTNADSLFKNQLDFLIKQSNQLVEIDKATNKTKMKENLEQVYAKIQDEYRLPFPNGRRNPKPMLFARWFAASGVSGYFGPFFNEVHVNQLCLPVEYPFTLAHEMAHQFGITSEAEANFFAWIVCSNSDSPAIQYSGSLMLLRYFLYDVSKKEDMEEFAKKISPKVKEDFIAIRKHWQSLRIKKLDEIQSKANNLYLKTNQVKGGTKDYNRVVKLVLQWKMQNL